MTIQLTDDDEGRVVVDDEGKRLGLITEVRGDTAFVDPDPGVSEEVMAALGWADADEDDYSVHEDAMAERAEDRIMLRGEI